MNGVRGQAGAKLDLYLSCRNDAAAKGKYSRILVIRPYARFNHMGSEALTAAIEKESTGFWSLRNGSTSQNSNNKPIDGDYERIKIDYSRTSERWFHRAGSATVWGEAVEPEFVMTKFRCYGALLKADFYHWNGYLIASERFKDVIERFEPGVHQFFPIDIIGTHKAVIGKAYVFVPCVAIRCFSTLSIGFEPVGWKDWGNHIWHVQKSCRHPRPIFDEEPAKGHHLWVAVDHWARFVLVSNDLKNAMLEAKLTNVVLSPMETEQRLRWMLPEIVKSKFAVDPPWAELLRAEQEAKAHARKG